MEKEEYQFKVLYLKNELDSVKLLLQDAPEFQKHYLDFNRWLDNALKEAQEGKRLVYALYRPIMDNGNPILQMIGVAFIKITGQTAELKSLFVHDSSRGSDRKYGSHLYKNVEEQLAKKGVSKIITDVPCENNQVSWFLIQHGFQINGLIERYKKDDFCYILSKDVKSYYTGDIFDWYNVVSWFLENVYQFEIGEPDILNSDKMLLIPILNNNKNLRVPLLPSLKGISLVYDVMEESDLLVVDSLLERIDGSIRIVFAKEFGDGIVAKLNENHFLTFDQNQVFELCGCPDLIFEKDEIKGIIVEMKNDYFGRIDEELEYFTYVKGAGIGKFAKKDDFVLFFVDRHDKYPQGALMGFGKIKKISCASPKEQWIHYGQLNPLFSQQEFDQFTSYKKEVIGIVVEDFTKISPISHDEFRTLFSGVISTEDIGNMYVNEDFMEIFMEDVSNEMKSIENKEISNNDPNGTNDTALLSPEKPYSNIRNLRLSLENCKTFIWWIDKHFSKKGFEPLAEIVDANKVQNIRILMGNSNVNDSMKKDYERFKSEMNNKEIEVECRVISDSSLLNKIHDRWVIAENVTYNLPPINTIYQNQFAEIKKTNISLPFDDWWDQGIELISGWNSILSAKK